MAFLDADTSTEIISRVAEDSNTAENFTEAIELFKLAGVGISSSASRSLTHIVEVRQSPQYL